MFSALRLSWLFRDTRDPWMLLFLRLLVVAAAVAATAVVTLAYLIMLEKGGGNYVTADWLISYPDSYIRRGLSRELFIALHDLTGWPLIWIAGVTQLAIYYLFVGLVLRLFWALSPSGLIFVVMLSPAFLLFALYEYPGFLRKEIAGFLALAVMANAFLAWTDGARAAWVSAALAVFVFAVFSHEANALLAPHMLMILAVLVFSRPMSRGWGLAAAAIVAAAAGSSIVLGILNPGVGQALAVCQEIVERGGMDELCTGSVAWLENNLEFAQDRIWGFISSGEYPMKYGLCLLIGLLPFVLFKPRSGGLKVQLLFLALGVLPLLPLFAVALDWGRWIYMIVASMAIVLLCLKHEGLVEERIGFPALLVVPLYALTWSPAFYGGRPITSRLPYLKRWIRLWIEDANQFWFT
jgi:hypothetical protein